MNPHHPFTKLLPAPLFFLATGLGAGATMILLSGDWLCTGVDIALLAGLLAVALNAAGAKRARRAAYKALTNTATVRPWGRRQQMILFLATVATVAVLAILWIPFMKAQNFRDAFAISPPAGISHLTVEPHYAGGPGDKICLIRFRAPAQTMIQIAAGRPLIQSTQDVQAYSPSDWQNLWDSYVGAQAREFNPAWRVAPIMKQPRRYGWSSSQPATSGPIESVNFFWDAVTEEAYAIYRAG